VEVDVYVWCYALLVEHVGKEEEKMCRATQNHERWPLLVKKVNQKGATYFACLGRGGGIFIDDLVTLLEVYR